MDVDLYNDPLGNDSAGKPVFLKDIWPTPQEVQEVMNKSVRQEMFKKEYSRASEGDERWQGMPVPQGELFKWDMQSTYVREAPYFDGMGKNAEFDQTDHRRACPGIARRFRHHRPYLARRFHREERSSGALPHQQRCIAQGLQSVRRAAR
jgi:hypothetical protein